MSSEESKEVKNIVWVNRLAPQITEEQVREHFVDCGEVSDVFVCSSRNRNSTYCFVTFVDESCAQKALDLNNTVLGDSQINVALADDRLYARSVKRTEAKARLDAQIDEAIQNMTKTEAYHYGFSQGKKYILKRMSGNQRHVQYRRHDNVVRSVAEH